MAAFLVCYTLVNLGYFISLKKSTLIPSQCVPYLGFLCDSRLQAFRLITAKKEKFISLVESTLASDQVSLQTFQKLSGKCISLSLAVPGARLFSNEINMAISKASRSSRPLSLSGALRSEIEHWLFLKDWSGFLPWRSEQHHQVKLYTDASSFAWGGVLTPDEIPIVATDYWPTNSFSSDMAVKEALALPIRSQPLKIALLMRVLKSLLIVPPWSMRGINRAPDPTLSLMRLRQYLRSFYPTTRL